MPVHNAEIAVMLDQTGELLEIGGDNPLRAPACRRAARVVQGLAILAEGKLDLPDPILERLDLVVAGVHYKFDLSAAAQTERIIRAMDNRHATICRTSMPGWPRRQA